MITIIGGAYQGKLDYALERYNKMESDVWHCTETSLHPDFTKPIIHCFHLFVLAQVQAQIDPLSYLKDHLEYFQDKIIISDDISCGLVPMEAEPRRWRECTGRCLSYLANHSDEVIRVFCGLGSRLK